MDFNYESLPGRVSFGRGQAASNLASELTKLGLSRVMLVAGPSELDLAHRLIAGAADRVAVEFTNVLPHVPAEVAEEARAAAAEHSIDGLVSVGGGSTTGTAKIVALTTGLPIVAVPSTYAGSEMTPVWGMTTAARKETGVDRRVLPKSVIYDSELTRTMPKGLAVASGFNAMAHCVEAFWGPGANPITTLAAAEGMSALSRGLRGISGETIEESAFDDLLFGAYLAGSAFAVAGSGLHHKICHALGGAFNLPHAETHTVVLPHVLAFNIDSIGTDADRMAAALNADDAVEGLFDLEHQLGSPRNLEEVGLRADQLDEAISVVSAKLPIANPRPVSESDIAEILTAAFRGR